MLDITIIGAGIAGATTAIGLAKQGHNITIIERRTPDQLKGGAGVHIQPNGVRAFTKFGLYERLAALSCEIDGLKMMRYNGELLSRMDKNYGETELWVCRADCAFELCKIAAELGVTLRYGVEVQELDASKPSIKLASGEEMYPDLIIGADGINSFVRRKLYPDYRIEMQDQCTFTAAVSWEAMQHNPALEYLTRSRTAHFRIGPGRFVIGCVVPPAKLMDLQMVDAEFSKNVTPELEEATEKALTGQFLDEKWVNDRWNDFDNEIRALIAAAGPWRYWRQAVCRNMPSWSNDAGTVLLIGDASHAIVPFAGQGACQAIEDAAFLSVLLPPSTSKSSLSTISKAFEATRRSRVDKICIRADNNAPYYCAPDGPLQQKRDMIFRTITESLDEVTANENADTTSPEFWKWVDTYDVFAEAEEVRNQLNVYGDFGTKCYTNGTTEGRFGDHVNELMNGFSSESLGDIKQ